MVQAILEKTEKTGNTDSKTSRVAIVGGGKAGLQLLIQFNESDLTQVVYVVDKDPAAMAVVAAQKKQIFTYTDFKSAIAENEVDFIFEVTGSDKVAALLQNALTGKNTKLVTHEMSFIMLKVMDDNRNKTTALVRNEISGIGQGIGNSLEAMGVTITDIKRTMAGLSLLSINARIEAAHAGEFGKGFDIVAQHVEESAESVRSMIGQIADVNSNILAISKQIENSLRKLA
jgi:hypothetical protein